MTSAGAYPLHGSHPDAVLGKSGARAVTGRKVATPERVAIWLVYAAALNTAVLCLLNTRAGRLPSFAIIISEILIVLVALPVLLLRLNLGSLLLLVCVCSNAFVLALLEQSVDFKPLRDLLMPVIFVWLGYIVSGRESADRVLRNLALIAVIFGLVEFVFPTIYASFFDALAFFTSRGFGANNPFATTVLQIRPGAIGRSLLPFLGARRISSIFLEPVALGNFAVLTAAWAFSKPRSERRQAAFFLFLAAVMIVMADARFGSMMIVVLLLASSSGAWRFRTLPLLLPFGAIALVMAVGWHYGDRQVGDNMLGRLRVSGSNLLDMQLSNWFGLPGRISMDAGYGYIIQRVGVPMVLIVWSAFCLLPLKDDQARRFHLNVALYATSLLCISGSSLFALKTSAVLWFLLGTSIAHRSVAERFRWPGSVAAPAAVTT